MLSQPERSAMTCPSNPSASEPRLRNGLRICPSEWIDPTQQEQVRCHGRCLKSTVRDVQAWTPRTECSRYEPYHASALADKERRKNQRNCAEKLD